MDMTGGWFLLALLGKLYDDKIASKERNICWHRMRQDPYHELDSRGTGRLPA